MKKNVVTIPPSSDECHPGEHSLTWLRCPECHVIYGVRCDKCGRKWENTGRHLSSCQYRRPYSSHLFHSGICMTCDVCPEDCEPFHAAGCVLPRFLSPRPTAD